MVLHSYFETTRVVVQEEKKELQSSTARSTEDARCELDDIQ